MLGMSPGAYLLRALRGVRASELEQALLLLPFNDVLSLLGYINNWLQEGAQVSSAGHAHLAWSTPTPWT